MSHQMNSSCSRITENSLLAKCVIDVLVCTVNLTQSRSDSASEMSTVRKPSPSVYFEGIKQINAAGRMRFLIVIAIPNKCSEFLA